MWVEFYNTEIKVTTDFWEKLKSALIWDNLKFNKILDEYKYYWFTNWEKKEIVNLLWNYLDVWNSKISDEETKKILLFLEENKTGKVVTRLFSELFLLFKWRSSEYNLSQIKMFSESLRVILSSNLHYFPKEYLENKLNILSIQNSLWKLLYLSNLRKNDKYHKFSLYFLKTLNQFNKRILKIEKIEKRWILPLVRS